MKMVERLDNEPVTRISNYGEVVARHSTRSAKDTHI